MSVALAQRQCVPCRTGSPSLTDAQVSELIQQVSGWAVVIHSGVPRLRRAFKFADYLTALAFVQNVGEMAEEQDHHPRVIVEWGRVEVEWWTHIVNGLHMNDFIAAAKTDQLYPATDQGASLRQHKA